MGVFGVCDCCSQQGLNLPGCITQPCRHAPAPPPSFSPLSSLFSPSLTKTYVTRLSPPNTSSLQSTPLPLIFPWSETCEERGGGRNREREGKSLEEAMRHLWTLEGKRLACLHQITSAWETVGKIAERWVWERHRVVETFSWNACVTEGGRGETRS